MSLWAFSPQKVTVPVAFYENELTILVRVCQSGEFMILGLTCALALRFSIKLAVVMSGSSLHSQIFGQRSAADAVARQAHWFPWLRITFLNVWRAVLHL